MYDRRSTPTAHARVPERLPPWARVLDAFAAACTRCGDCAQSCPTGVIDMSGAFPELDFARGGCTFCGDCVAACSRQAFDVAAWIARVAPWSDVAAIGDACVAHGRVVCRACADCCECGAITFRRAMGGVRVPVLDGGSCNGCGACVRACPARAIRIAAPTRARSLCAGRLQ